MVGLLLCVLALGTTYQAARKSLHHGLIAVLFWGYFWGILRANVPVTSSYFLFDCGMAGFYAAQGQTLFGDKSKRISILKAWTLTLLLWPCLLVFIPFQHPLVALVGLRGAVFFLPLLLAGALLTDEGVMKISTGLATLNLIVMAFAFGEYFLGVPRFYPENASTVLIYASNDVAGYQYLRIPGTFGAAHVFGGSMVLSMPFIYAAWCRPEISKKLKMVLFGGLISALLCVLMSATRLNFVIAGVLVLGMVLTGRFSFSSRAMIVAAVVILGFVAAGNERLGRFKSLDNNEMIAERVHGSVNRNFWEVLNEYPMGNGLGGGGTNMPFFLQGMVRHPVSMENEYARIMLETGIPGLVLWISFILWFIVGGAAFAPSPWKSARMVALVACIGYYGVGMIGTGMLTSVPPTALLLLYTGWLAVRPAGESAVAVAPERRPAVRYSARPRTGEGVA